MANPFVHVELYTDDVPNSKNFYTKLFDWKMEDLPLEGYTYTMIRVGDGTGGGLMQNPMTGSPSMWLAYVAVENIQTATEKAKSLGANIIKDVTEIKGMDWLAIFVDPTGAMLGMWQPKIQ